MRLQGTVKWFDPRKGYGFIEQAGAEDVFVHYSAITTDGFRTLNDGDLVEFEIADGERGPQAENVVRLGDAPEEGAGASAAEESEEEPSGW